MSDGAFILGSTGHFKIRTDGAFDHCGVCCLSFDLTCPSAAVHDGCLAFSPSSSKYFGICITGEPLALDALNQANPGYLMTRVADGEYELVDAGIRKIEMTYTPVADGSDEIVMRGYLWEGGAWVLKKTVGGPGSNSFRNTGYRSHSSLGAIWKVWAIDPWWPETLTLTLASLTACGCAITYHYDDGIAYSGKVVGWSLTPITLDLDYVTFSLGAECGYVGRGASVTIELYDNDGDCEAGTNLIKEVTVPIYAQVWLRFDRHVGVTAAEDGGGREIFRNVNQKYGAGVVFNKAGETIVTANSNDCGDFPVPLTSGGTGSVTIPPTGS